MNIALFGFGNVGRSFVKLLERHRAVYPFRVVAIHTAHHGTAYDLRGAIGHVSGFMGLVVNRPSVQADEKAATYARRAEQAGVREILPVPGCPPILLRQAGVSRTVR